MASMIRYAFPVAVVALLMAPFTAHAEDAYPRTINQRQANQQRRIFNGVKDDQINRQEYRNLEQRSLSVARQEQRDRRDGNGFSPRERYQLNERLDRISHSIYRDRHD